jgi:hypothetical protein
MSDRCARIALLLALLPFLFGTWALVLAFDGSSLQIPTAVGTLLAIGLTIVAWRRYVCWSVLRSTSTIGLTLLALAQIALWRPLWSSGCSAIEDYLRISQSLSSLGLWLAVCALLWWGGLWIGRRPGPHSDGLTRRFVMSPNGLRLVVGIALIPFLAGLFWIILFALDQWSSNTIANAAEPVVAYAVCAVLAVAIWLLLWRRAVEWTRKRRWITLALALVLLASPISVFCQEAFYAGALGHVWEVFCWLAPVFAWALWLAGTAWAWRSDRAGTLPGLSATTAAGGPAWCPRCGYSLTGLHEVRCPECGWSSTVDDIVALSLARALAVP